MNGLRQCEVLFISNNLCGFVHMETQCIKYQLQSEFVSCKHAMETDEGTN